MNIRVRFVMYWAALVALLLILVGSVGAQYSTPYAKSVDAQSMIDVLDYYCQSIDPIQNCGVYQNEINQAQLRAAQISTMMRSYSATQRVTITDSLLSRVSRTFNTTQDTNTKVVAAFYYVYFSQADVSSSASSGDDLFGYLFDGDNTIRDVRTVTSVTPVRRTSTSRSTSSSSHRNTSTSYRSGNGTIENVWSANGTTRVNSSSNSISLTTRSGSLEVGVKAVVGRYTAQPSSGYRVVARIDNNRNTYAGNYESDGSWEIALGNSVVRSADQMTISLLCDRCTGTQFNGNGYEGWAVLDSVTYRIQETDYNSYSRRNTTNRYYNDSYYRNRFDDRVYNSRYDYYDGRYHRNDRYRDDYYRGNDSREDLGITRVEYDYEFERNDFVIELTTTVRNYDRDQLRLDELEYDIFVDNRTINSRDYSVRHIRTECDDYNRNSSSSRNIDIEGYDECDFTVEITVDDYYVRDGDDVEVDVTLISDDDRNSSNNRDSVSFRAY